MPVVVLCFSLTAGPVTLPVCVRTLLAVIVCDLPVTAGPSSAGVTANPCLCVYIYSCSHTHVHISKYVCMYTLHTLYFY